VISIYLIILYYKKKIEFETLDHHDT